MLLPKKVGPFTLMRKLGSNGVTDSFVGILDEPAGKQVIVRRVLPSIVNDPSQLAALESRVKDLMVVRHPVLVPMLDQVAHEEDRYVVEEWTDAVDLEQIIGWCRETGSLIPHNVYLNLGTQICNGLEALHSRPGTASGAEHVLHLALRPASVLVTRDGKVLVGDYGLASAPMSATSGGIKLRMEYLAPEQTHPDQKLSPATDIFALGSVLYEMLNLKALFKADSNLQTIHKVRRAEVTTQLLEVKEVLSGLDKVLYRALSLNPRHRYQRAFVLREDLRGLMAGYSFANIADETRAFLEPMFASRGAAGAGSIDEVSPNIGGSDGPQETTASLLRSSIASGKPAPSRAERFPTSPAYANEPQVDLEPIGEMREDTMALLMAATGGEFTDSDVPVPTSETTISENSQPEPPAAEDEELSPFEKAIGANSDDESHTSWVQRPGMASNAPPPPEAGQYPEEAPPTAPSESTQWEQKQVEGTEWEQQVAPPKPVPGLTPPPAPTADIPIPPKAPTPEPAPQVERGGELRPPAVSSATPGRAPQAAPPTVVEDDLAYEPGGSSMMPMVAAGVVIIGGLLLLFVCAGVGGGLGGLGLMARSTDAPVQAASIEPAPVVAPPPKPKAKAKKKAKTPMRATSAGDDRPITVSSVQPRPRPVPRPEPPPAPASSYTAPAPAPPPAPVPVPETYTPLPVVDEIGAAALDPSTPEEAGPADIESFAANAKRGQLTGADKAQLAATSSDQPEYSRAYTLLYQDAKARSHVGDQRLYLKALMAVDENRYKPALVVEEAALALHDKDYDSALAKASLAERHWARLPSEQIFSRKAMIYEIQASSHLGLFYASGGENLDELDHAIRGYQKYQRHVETRSRRDLAGRADDQLAKLYDIQRRLQ